MDRNLLAVLHRPLKVPNLSRVAEGQNVTPPAITNSLARLLSHFQDDLLIQSGREMVAAPLALQMAALIEEYVARGRHIALTRAEFDPETSDQERICFYRYRARNRVERFFNKIKQCRREATRYDKLGASYVAFVQLSSTGLWLGANEPTS